ncbi:MAG: HAMP domain-containing protein [Clostridiales bacterium]|nr:HAMP domain-containing protein [Clostridiales bacterium]
MKLNVTTKLALFIAILIIISSLVIGLLSISISTDALLDETEEMMLEYAIEGARLVEMEVANSLAVLREVASDQAVASMDWEIQKAELSKRIDRLGYLDMGVVTPDGVARYVNSDEQAQLGDRDYVKKAFNGETNVSDILISRVTNEPVLMEAAPIVSNNRVVGVLIGRRDGNAISNITNLLGVGQRGYAFIVGGDSTLYAHVDKQLVLDQRNVFEEIETGGDLKNYGIALKELGLGKLGIVRYEFLGENRLTAIAPIEGTDWTIGIGNYESDILQKVSSLRNMILLVALVVLVAGIVAAIILARVITRPIKGLRQAADKLALGDTEVELVKASNDEIGDLVKSFELMVENITKQTEIAEKIGQGDLTVEVKPRSDKDLLGHSLKKLVVTLRGLVDETKTLTVAAANGQLNTRGNADAFEGGYKDIIDGINSTLDGIMEPLSIALDAIDKLAGGEKLEAIENGFKGEYSVLIDNLNKVRGSIRALADESLKLTRAAAEGELSYRADTSQLRGIYQRIVDGINEALDSVIAPIQEASEVLQEMARGNLNVLMEGDYKGDNAELKESLNSTIESLLRYINDISNVLAELAIGNFDITVSGDYQGNFVEIRDSLNSIINALNTMMGEINEAANQVAAGSMQVSDASQALSQGSTEQASSLEELTASINEIAEQTKQNALNANEADEYARLALKKASEGNKQMEEMLQAMDEINESSQNISKIIKVIDDIAFQTNILALNAAVEAARAGQHGKGFAVVAEEVRTLAARSAAAANETIGLIEGSIEKVKVGTNIANDTAQALNEILEEVEKSASLAKEIANASNEQASGISQINKGIEQVSQVVQNNSATAEESAAASEELSSQAELLKEMVDKVKLKKNVSDMMLNNIQSIESKESNGREIEDIKPRIILNDDEFDKY